MFGFFNKKKLLDDTVSVQGQVKSVWVRCAVSVSTPEILL